MKKSLAFIFVFVLLVSTMLAACNKPSDDPMEFPIPSPISTRTPDATEPVDTSTPDATENNGDISGDDDWSFGIYRPVYYNLNVFFARLVGEEACLEWEILRTPEEHNNECIAVAFVKHFNIPKEDFERANEEIRIHREERGHEHLATFELYPVDLIYTFDNELINEYFLWENGPYPDPR